MSDKRAILCIWCGMAVRYLPFDKESNRMALEKMLLHEKICDKNPLVIGSGRRKAKKIKALQSNNFVPESKSRIASERDRLKDAIKDAFNEAGNSPELNMSNYDINQVTELNSSMILIFQILQKALEGK